MRWWRHRHRSQSAANEWLLQKRGHRERSKWRHCGMPQRRGFTVSGTRWKAAWRQWWWWCCWWWRHYWPASKNTGWRSCLRRTGRWLRISRKTERRQHFKVSCEFYCAIHLITYCEFLHKKLVLSLTFNRRHNCPTSFQKLQCYCYLRQGDCVFIWVYLFVSWLAGYQNYGKTTPPIFAKFDGNVAHGKSKKSLYFDGNSGHVTLRYS